MEDVVGRVCLTSNYHSLFCSNDIGPPSNWDQLIRIINQVVPITGFAGPGHWNDMDLLEVGNAGMTAAEQQTHFSFWSAAKLVFWVWLQPTGC
jgi:alpha-galactosidase